MNNPVQTGATRTRIVRYDPRQQLLRRFWIGAAVLVLGVGVFAAGHWHGAASNAMLIDEATVLRRSLQQTSADLDQSRQQLVSLEAGAQIDNEALAQVRAEVAVERAKVARLEHEVMLFKSLMDSSVRTTGLALQGIELSAESSPSRVRYRLTLLQRADQQELKGSMRVSVSGQQGGSSRQYPLAALDPTQPDENIALGFRYFQVFEGTMQLPDGFVPETIRVKADARGAQKYSIDRVIDWVLQ